MKHLYLDWNIFNKIEHNADPIYNEIENLITSGEFISPYSNAHMNDLIRGYRKNPNYIDGHLGILQRLTNNLCITQYWGNKETTWHYRDVREFFNSSLDDIDTSYESYLDLAEADDTGLVKIQMSLLKLQRLPENFKDLYKMDPIFELMFPKSMREMTMLSLCEDLFDFSKASNKDYTLYKNLRSYIVRSRMKLQKQEKIFREVDKNSKNHPVRLDFDEQWEKYLPKSKTSENPAYQRITDLYFKIDLKGYKSDERFSNMLDDSLHVFYGAHCDYFLTIDDKCLYKAREVYSKLKIQTEALTPLEFLEKIKL